MCSQSRRPPSSLEGCKLGHLGLTTSGDHALPIFSLLKGLKNLKKAQSVKFPPQNPEKSTSSLLPEKCARKEKASY